MELLETTKLSIKGYVETMIRGILIQVSFFHYLLLENSRPNGLLFSVELLETSKLSTRFEALTKGIFKVG